MRSIDSWNKGDLDAYMQMCDPDVVLHGILGLEPGIESVKRFYQRFHKAFPGIQIIVKDLFARVDKLACKFTTSGTHTAEFMGIPPTGKPVKFVGITIFIFRDGKCIDRWNQADFFGMVQQLGAIPEKPS